MMRALWTGASGMIAQQDAVDTISNNLSNVNTTGYKKETVEFKTLLYSKLQTKTTDNNGDPKPVIGQVGAGVRTASITSRYTQGSLNSTGNTYDFALEGEGFFQVQLPDGTVAYTRNGAFNMSIGSEGLTLCTADGYPVLNEQGEPLVFGLDKEANQFFIDDEGNFYYNEIKEVPIEGGQTEETENGENAEEKKTKKIQQQVKLGVKFGIVQFNNPTGLLKLSDSLLMSTDSSGEPMPEAANSQLKTTKVHSGYLEGSNVETVDEMVNLIVAQRAYEMNSKVITASDQMLQQANNLRS
ncbi:MAG: flagellar hook-basal body protein [Lachnospiraceae bacterium]|nr:flagellar hook-basal body protein [Lachnospiraceae bacterium]